MEEFVFVPVCVNRGRKFRGIAYSINAEVQYNGGNWAYTSWSVKLWDPVSMKYVYANPDFVEKREATPEQIEGDKISYVNHTINSTVAWCLTKSPNQDEGRKFARNCLLKHHPEMKEYIDKALPDERDVVAAVERTLRWAVNLRTRPTVIYGRVCKGGRPYGKTETVRKAWNVLDRKGYTKLDGFKEAWLFMTNMLELPDYGVKL